ncbi:MAG TPA: cation-transporting P-type ATPase, partial [Anaerolineae bacterium]|nr:cation-transporting P-type ATPase [Anaerolineae bacterium]
LKQLLPAFARVRRDGCELQLPASELVPGDVLILAEGDNVPADARLIEEYGLRSNNSTLTGEALPARKSADASLRAGFTEIERPNLVFAGTSIVSGTGRAVVYATGMLTQFGRIANLTQSIVDKPAPLQQQMQRLTRRITLVAIGLGAIVFVVGAFDLNMSALEALILAIGLIVAVVPEGLVPITTLTLAMAVQRLARRGVIVKELAVMDTLGHTSVICTDKSGTLTQNQMTVRGVWVAGQRLSVSGVGYEPRGDFSPQPIGLLQTDLQALLHAAWLCNNSRLNPPTTDRPRWTSLGDQTEVALRVLALKGGLYEALVSRQYPRVHELPFDARRKRMSTIHRQGTSEVAFVKGAPKEVLQLCTRILINGAVRDLDEATRAAILAANDADARNALRVLALARRELPAARRSGGYSPERIEGDLTFLGLASMMDPPRPDVAAAVKTCHEAGIRLVMITGDYGLTAESVARRIGLLSTPQPRIMTGAEVDELNDDELKAALADEIIFARMAPEHKLRVVAAFQQRGEVVAVTGDGVNDAPALRKADVGIVMGVTGTDVAKEAADVIITDDQFTAIPRAIEEGRAVYDNLRKFITYIFASNVPEIMPFVMMALFNIPLALTVVQILVIDLGTDLLPALALGVERPEPNVMRRPPRRRDQPLIDRALVLRAFGWLGLIETGLAYGAFFAVFAAFGYTDWLNLPRIDVLLPGQHSGLEPATVYWLASTVFLASVVMAQIGNALTCRTETDKVHHLGWFSNRYLLAGMAISVLLIAALIYVPGLNSLFEHVPMPIEYWGALVWFGPIVFLLDRGRKAIARRREARWLHPVEAPIELEENGL